MTEQPKCLYCGASHETIPLVQLVYQGRTLYVCSSHLPVLIHEPQKLALQLAEAARRNEPSE